MFDSKYQAADDKWRNTAYNGNYVVNALGGYEIKIKGKNYLILDIKAVWTGGRHYIPLKSEVTNFIEAVKNNPAFPVRYFDEIYDEQRSYASRYNDYLRADFRIGYKINHKRYSEEFGLDLQNITNQKALFGRQYDAENGKLINRFSPMFLYRIQF